MTKNLKPIGFLLDRETEIQNYASLNLDYARYVCL